jgi:hypothetical protein
MHAVPTSHCGVCMRASNCFLVACMLRIVFASFAAAASSVFNDFSKAPAIDDSTVECYIAHIIK